MRHNILLEQVVKEVIFQLHENSVSDKEINSIINDIGNELEDLPEDLIDAFKSSAIKQEAAMAVGISLGLAVPAILGIISRIGKSVDKIITTKLGKAPQDKSKTSQYLHTLGTTAIEKTAIEIIRNKNSLYSCLKVFLR